MTSIDDKTTGIGETETLPDTENVPKTVHAISLNRIGQYTLIPIAALIIGIIAYQRYPRTIENATVIAKGEDHVDLLRDNGTDYPEPYTELQPTISLNNYNVCLRGEGLDKLNIGDKLKKATYFLCPLTRCNCLKSYER